jgi:UDP-N-acetylmuramoyl-tripeptide--D-alanyl-D-alanine ligase
MQIELTQIAGVLESELGAGGRGVMATGWSIDSRTVERGDVFFALEGERVDGHRFVREAFEKGAALAVVSHDVSAAGLVLQVPNVRAALGALAKWARERWGRSVVGVTGSAGKTTCKDIIAALLGERFRVGKTVGNFNNNLGVPLSVLRFPDDAQVGVLELGMNHAGEIRELAGIARPQVGVVTNVGYAHIEGFDSIDGIALAKRELIESLPADGTAILNADDRRVLEFGKVHRGAVITYGIQNQATIRAERVRREPGKVEFDAGGVHFSSKLTGVHGILNILAGLATASVFRIGLTELVEPVSALEPGRMRGERRIWNGITIFDDCYNSNPEAVRSMIDVLKDEPARRRIAVLGEMLELGHWAEVLHREVGEYLAKAGIQLLVGIRGAGGFMIDAAISGGMSPNAAYFFDEPEEAGVFLRGYARPGDAILFKGSRGTHVERALAAFTGGA